MTSTMKSSMKSTRRTTNELIVCRDEFVDTELVVLLDGRRVSHRWLRAVAAKPQSPVGSSSHVFIPFYFQGKFHQQSTHVA